MAADVGSVFVEIDRVRVPLVEEFPSPPTLAFRRIGVKERHSESGLMVKPLYRSLCMRSKMPKKSHTSPSVAVDAAEALGPRAPRE